MTKTPEFSTYAKDSWRQSETVSASVNPWCIIILLTVAFFAFVFNPKTDQYWATTVSHFELIIHLVQVGGKMK